MGVGGRHVKETADRTIRKGKIEVEFTRGPLDKRCEVRGSSQKKNATAVGTSPAGGQSLAAGTDPEDPAPSWGFVCADPRLDWGRISWSWEDLDVVQTVHRFMCLGVVMSC